MYNKSKNRSFSSPNQIVSPAYKPLFAIDSVRKRNKGLLDLNMPKYSIFGGDNVTEVVVFSVGGLHGVVHLFLGVFGGSSIPTSARRSESLSCQCFS